MSNSARPAFLARIGGSDFDFVCDYYKFAPQLGHERTIALMGPKLKLLRALNGYYDRTDDPDNIERFCRLFMETYRNCADMLVCGATLLSEFLPETINPVFRIDTSHDSDMFRAFFRSIAERQETMRFHPYGYVENILRGDHTLFRAFTEILSGKKVLAITPFEQSIQENFARRQDFFPGYQYPDFALKTYNTPITYDGLPEEFYPDQDWFQTLARMQDDISRIDFDIALLSCGSYAMPLGLHIRDLMGRKAIYVGGCLQLYFGIMGRRYDNPWFVDQINPAAFILPVERDRYLSHVHVTPATAREAFGAYF